MKTSRIIFNMLAIASLVLAANASADETTKEGYVTDTRGNVVKNSYNECWRTGFWTPAMAIKECDPNLLKKTEPKLAETKASAAAAPVPAPVAGAPVAAKKAAFTLQSEALFDFDKAALHADGKKKLDNEVVGKMKEYAQVDIILVTGHADRIGSDAYNQALSQRRADAVKDYLVGQGVASDRIETAAKGESEPVVSCDSVRGKKLIECLHPNRRVEVEVKAQK